jgi:DNA-binding CsgD family transcriptional regulator
MWLARMPLILERLNEANRVLGHAYQASFLARFAETKQEAEELVNQVQHHIDRLDPRAKVDAQILVGSALYYVSRNDEALQVTRDAASTALALNDQRERARSLNNLGLMLLHVYDAEVAAIFEPLRDAVEKTGSWRFSHVSHWMQATYYALEGNLEAARSAQALQLAITPTETSQKAKLVHLHRHSENLCRLLSNDLSLIINDFITQGLPRPRDASYEILIDAAAAYALGLNFVECEKLLRQAEKLREAFSVLEFRSTVPAQFVEIIALCSVGKWQQARRLCDRQDWMAPTLQVLRHPLTRFCDGPPFVGVAEALIPCFGQPYVGLAAQLAKLVLDHRCENGVELTLTLAEMEVLRLLGLGKSNKEIAAARSRSVETVKRQVASVYQKLGVENRTSAVAVARSRGLL